MNPRGLRQSDCPRGSDAQWQLVDVVSHSPPNMSAAIVCLEVSAACESRRTACSPKDVPLLEGCVRMTTSHDACATAASQECRRRRVEGGCSVSEEGGGDYTWNSLNANIFGTQGCQT